MKVFIHGRGLAGSWLAYELHRRGVEVLVFDPHPAENASRVAAGLINPTTGSRPKSTWRSEVLLPFAREAYDAIEREIGASIWTPRVIRRVFLTEKDATLWSLAEQRGVGVDWTPIPGASVDGVSLPFGGVEYAGATVDTNALIDGIGAMLERHGYLTTEPHRAADADVTVWCHGWRAATDALWSWLPFQPVKGEILDAVIDGPPLNAVYIRGIWILPSSEQRAASSETPAASSNVQQGGPQTVGSQQHVRIGSTHDWDDLTEQPTDHGRRTLVEKAQVILGRDVRVIGQRAGIRPAARSKRPYIGLHPEDPTQAIINGLGAKGSLWAPWAARQLADLLLEGKPVDQEVDIQQWWNV